MENRLFLHHVSHNILSIYHHPDYCAARRPPGETDTHPNVLDKSLPPTPAPGSGAQKKSGADKKKEIMERMQPAKGSRPTDAAQQKGDRWVKDPVTGQDILLKDPKFKGEVLL